MSHSSKSVFEQFLDEINDGLPPQIVKSIDLIRELDEQKQQLSEQTIDMAKNSLGQNAAKKKLDNCSSSNPKKTNSADNNNGDQSNQQQQKKVLSQIKANQDQIQRLSDYKIDLARKVFAFVELNLSKIKDNKAKQQGKLQQMSNSHNQSSISQKSKRICKQEKKGKKKQNGQQVQKRLAIQASSQDEDFYMREELAEPVPYEMNRHLLRAFGPTNTGSSANQLPANQQKSASSLARNGAAALKEAQEPTYCFCNNISYGDMIACDNNNCPYEWFHFPCVGLSSKPVGSGWYCQKCLPSQQQPKRSSSSSAGNQHQSSSNSGAQSASNQQQQQQNTKKNSRRQKQGDSQENGENMTASFGFQSVDDQLNNNTSDKPLTRKKLQGNMINGNCKSGTAIQSANSVNQNSRPPTRSRRHL